MYLVKRIFLYFWYFLPVILIYGIISWLSDQPRLPGPSDYPWRFIWFKLAHLLVYASLGWFMFRAWRQTLPKRTSRYIFITSLVLALILAIADEYHQSLVAGREGTIRDVMIDLIGISTALCLQRRYNQSRSLWKQLVSRIKNQPGM